MRNPKPEARSSNEMAANSKFGLLNFRILKLEFLSDLGFRALDFPKGVYYANN